MNKIKKLIGRIGLKLQRIAGHENPEVIHRYKHYEDIIKGERETIDRLEAMLKNKRNIIFVSHDAQPGGAEMLSVNIIRQLSEVFKYNVHVIVKTGGDLLGGFRRYASSLLCLDTDTTCEDDLKKWVLKTGANCAMCNTAVTGDVLKALTDIGVTCISMIHEMKSVIQEFHCEDNLSHIIAHAKHIVLPSAYVQRSIESIKAIPEDKLVICPQGLYNVEVARKSKADCKAEVCERFGLSENSLMVLNVGYGNHRKGYDLFAKCAIDVCNEFKDCVFMWVGVVPDETLHAVNELTKGTAAEGKVIFAGLQSEMYPFYLACDVFLLTSREDPFPSVVMEAVSYSLPVVAFDGGGGYVELITPCETGFLAPMEDVQAMSGFVSQLLEDKSLRTTLGERGLSRFKEISHFNSYVGALLSLLGEKYEAVSVIIPNYNYANYLSERIESILAQTYPVNEIIILDDASTDESAEVISSFEKRYPLRIKAIYNSTNSGNVFFQWERGLREAAGDYIWIAEADDSASPRFLQKLMDMMSADKDIVLGYTQSKAMDENGNVTAEDYRFYTDDIDSEIYKTDHIADGQDVIKKRLAVKNTILNVSSVVFKNSGKLLALIQEAKKYKVAGDLRFYIDILKDGGKLCFASESLNYHRTHSSSVTRKLDAQRHYDEICECQQYVADLYFDGELPEAAKEYRVKVWDYLVG